MRDLERRLRTERLAHRLLLTDERHTWPPAEACTRALAWLELQAMATALRPRDEAMIDLRARRRGEGRPRARGERRP